MALTLLPYLLGYALSTKDNHYIWLSAANSADFNTYLAWMKQAQDGNLLFKLKYTTEPHASVVFHPLFLALGFLSRGTGLSLIFISHLARILFGFLLLYSAYLFIAYFLRERARRRTAFFLVCFSSGFGGFLLAGKTFFSFIPLCALKRDFTWSCFQSASMHTAQQVFQIAGLNENAPLDLWVPEAVTAWSLYGMFLHPLSQAMLLLSFLFFLYFTRTVSRKHALLSALCLFFLFFTHAYDVLIAYPVMALYALYVLFLSGTVKNKTRFLSGTGMVFLFSLLPILYQAWVVKNNPVFSMWAQNPRLSPSLINALLGFGFPLLFSLAAFCRTHRENIKENFSFLFLWCGLVFVLLYIPVSFQRRLAEGVHIPFCALASYGMHDFFERIRAKKESRGKSFDKQKAIRIVLILASFTNICVFTSELKSTATSSFPYFLPAQTDQAFQFLNRHTNKNDVVISSYAVGNFIPARSGNTVYLGHYDQTIHAARKQKDVSLFYGKNTSCAWRRAFLKKHRIRYVFFSPEEQTMFGLKTLSCPFLTPVYHNKTVTIYKKIE